MRVLFLTWLLIAIPQAQADDLIPGYWEQTPLPQTGVATFYAVGMMEYVHGYRQERGQLPACPECVGTVALLRAGDIGRKVWLEPPDGERVGPFLVIDCARREDVAPLLVRNWVVDVSYEVGQLWGMDRPLDGVTVLADPADGVFVGPLRAPTPFFVNPKDVVISAPTPVGTAAPLAPPTPWPNRQPVPLGRSAAALVALSTQTAVPATPTPPRPTPLTPIITTPTPQGGPPPEPLPTDTLLASQPAPASAENVAVGRPGLELLLAAETPAPPATVAPATATSLTSPRASPTVRPLRTPRATSAPILPPGAVPTPAPLQDNVPPLVRLWRSLLSLILH
jgi:hypothetical protein